MEEGILLLGTSSNHKRTPQWEKESSAEYSIEGLEKYKMFYENNKKLYEKYSMKEKPFVAIGYDYAGNGNKIHLVKVVRLYKENNSIYFNFEPVKTLEVNAKEIKKLAKDGLLSETERRKISSFIQIPTLDLPLKKEVIPNFVIPTALRKAILQKKLILFVGSGFSGDFVKSRNWKELIYKILELVSEDHPVYNNFKGLLEEHILDELDVLKNLEKIPKIKKNVYEIIQEEFQVRKEVVKNSEKHQALWKVSNKIFTTNFDQIIEYCSGSEDSTNVTIERDNPSKLKNLLSLDKFVLKLHGTYTNPHKCIIFEEDFDVLYNTGSEMAVERLRDAIKDYTILFIGFSLSDPYVQRQFEYIKALMKDQHEQHFMVTVENQKRDEYGVELIKIDSWNEILPLLNTLADINPENHSG
ncbi:SIR2 family NAD-dependent protein deacylase [Saccharibacillus deserti]|uniref:SIR2 family NAD-dependent protein deacylase n=1 Tax=Saccharibacillus deserti TaxID=1634444 RepID=UPI00155778B2|nr:SIR2 family protein [Saccharibacillus deserti]